MFVKHSSSNYYFYQKWKSRKIVLDNWLVIFFSQAFRFVYFNGYLLFQDIFSKLLPLKNVMRETQLQNI